MFGLAVISSNGSFIIATVEFGGEAFSTESEKLRSNCSESDRGLLKGSQSMGHVSFLTLGCSFPASMVYTNSASSWEKLHEQVNMLAIASPPHRLPLFLLPDADLPLKAA